jgi:hypothetical protein
MPQRFRECCQIPCMPQVKLGLGVSPLCGYVWDNELGEREERVGPFLLAQGPVTVAQMREFIVKHKASWLADKSLSAPAWATGSVAPSPEEGQACCLLLGLCRQAAIENRVSSRQRRSTCSSG